MAAPANLPAGVQRKATRKEHQANMRRVEELLTLDGMTPTLAARTIAAETGIGTRMGYRYVRAVRNIYAKSLEKAPLPTMEESIHLLHARSAQSIKGLEPDWKASIKALEIAYRMRGWLDKRVSVEVSGGITVEHARAIDGASEEELAALAAYHDARARRLAGVVGQLGEISAGSADHESDVVSSGEALPPGQSPLPEKAR